ncbi:MAG: hypothetical protein WB973_16780 [Thermoanaerobaculia bacterium]
MRTTKRFEKVCERLNGKIPVRRPNERDLDHISPLREDGDSEVAPALVGEID